MRRYYKGSDIPFRLSIKDKGGVIIPLASFDSLEVIFRTSGEQYTKYYKGGGITENEDGTYRIYANENAFGLLPDGLLKYAVKYTINGNHDEIRECETDIIIKTPKQFQPKANVQDKEITITENNSTSTVIPDGGYEGLGEVTINVEVPFPLEVKEVSITENESTTTITTGDGYSGMSEVNVNVKVPITIKLPNGIKFANSNITKFPDGFDFSEISGLDGMFEGASISDLSQIKFGGKPTSMIRTFSNSKNINKYPQIDTSEVINIEKCFWYNGIMEECPYSFPKAKNMYQAFYSSGIKNIPDFAYTATGSFYGCFDCTLLTTVPTGTFQGSDFQYAFRNINSLTSVGKLTFTNATSLLDMFASGKYIETAGGIISDTVTNLQGTFCDTFLMTSCGDIDCPNAIRAYGTFRDARSLINAPKFTSTKLQNIEQLFRHCYELVSIPDIDCTNVTSCGVYAEKDSKLTTVGKMTNLRYSIDFSYSPLLTVESIMNIINSIYDFTGNGTSAGYNQGKLILGSTNLAKLSDAEKAIATNKGWTLA